MLTVYYREYTNDLMQTVLTKTFRDLCDISDWIFNQMRQDYSGEYGNLVLHFPTGDKPSCITFKPEFRNSPTYFIHKIENNQGIIFSDGKYTAKQKHWNDEVRIWLKKCNERQYTPTFHFI